MTPLVLSLFPGIGLLDMAFEQRGFCVVRGPDLLWGGDIRRFHPPAGRFDGVIGGPPCQAHSHLGNVVARAAGQRVAENLIPEFERVVREASPAWFVMENVPDAPEPRCPGYERHRFVLDNRADFGGVQHRERAFAFGFDRPTRIGFAWWKPMLPNQYLPTVTASATVWKDGRAYGDHTERYLRDVMLPAQGLPADFLEDAPFTVREKIRAVGNGVPLPMGRAIADAVWRAVYGSEEAQAS